MTETNCKTGFRHKKCGSDEKVVVIVQRKKAIHWLYELDMDPAVTLNNILQKYDDPEKYEHTPPRHEWWYNNDYVCSPPRPKKYFGLQVR